MASIDDVIAHLKHMHDDIDDEVDYILSENADEFVEATVESARSVMKRGYWTGNLARLVKSKKNGERDYTITSNAHYSGFLEFGTRKMKPFTFMFPVYQEYLFKVRAELEQLLE